MPPETLHEQEAAARRLGQRRGVAAASAKCVKVLPHCKKFVFIDFVVVVIVVVVGDPQPFQFQFDVVSQEHF